MYSSGLFFRMRVFGCRLRKLKSYTSHGSALYLFMIGESVLFKSNLVISHPHNITGPPSSFPEHRTTIPTTLTLQRSKDWERGCRDAAIHPIISYIHSSVHHLHIFTSLLSLSILLPPHRREDTLSITSTTLPPTISRGAGRVWQYRLQRYGQGGFLISLLTRTIDSDYYKYRTYSRNTHWLATAVSTSGTLALLHLLLATSVRGTRKKSVLMASGDAYYGTGYQFSNAPGAGTVPR